MASEAVVRWITEGLRAESCPLCLAGHEVDCEYVGRFCAELALPGAEIAGFVGARGFCAEHISLFECVAGGRVRPATAVGDLYLATLERLASDLDGLDADGWLESAECPACVNRDRGAGERARRLMSEATDDATVREEFRHSGGLCVAHFVLAWDSSGEQDDRGLLRDVQRSATLRVAARVREDLQRQASGVRAGCEEREADSRRRAGRLMAGWRACEQGAPLAGPRKPVA
jgi:hypothetical protein